MSAQPHSHRAAVAPPARERLDTASLDDLSGPLTADGATAALETWLDARLAELESRLHGFTTPSSLGSWLQRR